MSEQEEVNAALKRFTPRARQSITLAQKDAEKSNHDCISVEHLLRGICLLKEGVAVEVLRAMRVDFQNLLSELTTAEKKVFTYEELRLLRMKKGMDEKGTGKLLSKWKQRGYIRQLTNDSFESLR